MGTITKALNLLNYFSTSRPQISLSEFKYLSSQDKATVYRHLTELEQNGFLEQDRITKGYRLGPAFLRLSAIREKTFPLRKVVSVWADALSKDIGELVHVSVLQGNKMSPVYHADLHSHGTRVSFDEASLLPLHATSSGLAMLAFGPHNLLDTILYKPLQAHTENTLTDSKLLKAEILDVKTTGFAESDQGFELDVHSFAVPVFAHDVSAIGTIAVALPKSRLSNETKQTIINKLFETSAHVSRSLGGTVPFKLEKLWKKAA